MAVLHQEDGFVPGPLWLFNELSNSERMISGCSLRRSYGLTAHFRPDRVSGSFERTVWGSGLKAYVGGCPDDLGNALVELLSCVDVVSVEGLGVRLEVE